MTSTKQRIGLTAVEESVARMAVQSLFKYHGGITDSKIFLGTDLPIRVQFTLERASGKSQMKPVPIQIPFPLHKVYSEADGINSNNVIDSPDVCLIVKDDVTKLMIQELSRDFPQHMVCIKKVLTLPSLRSKHKDFKQRRDLLQRFEVFLADDRIVPMLTKGLGQLFIKAKKLPIPISVTRKSSLPFAIHKSLSSTYCTIAAGGNCVSIIAGNTAMPVEHVVANILSVTVNAVPKFPKKWFNIRSIGIKLPASMELPIYNKTPEQLMEIARMAGVKPNYKQIPVQDGIDDGDNILVDRKRKVEADGKTKSPLLQALKKQRTIQSKKHEQAMSVEKLDADHENRTLLTKRCREPHKSSVVDYTAESTGIKECKISPSLRNENIKKIRKIRLNDNKLESPLSTTGVVNELKLKGIKEAPTTSVKRISAISEANPIARDNKAHSAEQTGQFIPTRKYDGSKAGYVFKKDKQGVGYYMDNPPVVDSKLFEALTRIRQGNKRHSYGGNGNKSSIKYRRKSR